MTADIRGDSYVHVGNSAPCSQGPGPGTVSGPTSTLQQASHAGQNLAQEALNYLTAPRDTTCLAASAAHWAAIVAVGGGIAGGLGGAALGAPTGGAASVPLAIGGAAELASVGGQAGFALGTGIGFFSCASGGGGRGRSDHDKEQSGEPNREVGDANRVIQEGKKYTDSDTGYTIHVSGNRVVITDPADGGTIVTRFINSQANTEERVLSGKWIPQ
jgi:hypothetical protein